MRNRRRVATGFTLIELMIVVAIIGILASIAMPLMDKAQLRARSAERGTILDAVARGINDTVSGAQGFPDKTDPTKWVGPNNPAWVAADSTSKRRFDYGLGGWKNLPVIVQGSCYYSYSFQADEATGSAPASMWVMAIGDLDGDGDPSVKTITYTSAGYSFYRDPAIPESPLAGQEDATTF